MENLFSILPFVLILVAFIFILRSKSGMNPLTYVNTQKELLEVAKEIRDLLKEKK